MNKKRLITGSILTGALIIGGVAMLLLFTQQGEAGDGGISGEQFEVSYASKAESIETSGNISAVEAQDATFPVSGRIREIHVSRGESVVENQLLAELDTDSLEYDLAKLEYEIDQEQNNGSQRTLELLRIQKDLLEADLRDTQLRAGIDGRVSAVHLDEGDSAGPEQSVLRIIDTRNMKASIPIDEIDVPKLREGQSVEFYFDAYPDEIYTGLVSSIPMEGRINNNGIAVLDVEVILTDPDEKIKPSFTFTARIIVSEVRDILILPKEAVLSQNEGNGMGLRITADNEDPQPVRLGIQEFDENNYRILSGAEAGDKFVSPSQLMGSNEGTSGGAMIRVPGAGGRPAGPGRGGS